MRTRHSLLLLALAAFAGSAFAAAPQASTAKPEPAKTEAAKSSAAAKPAHKDKRTCEQRGKTGHCEKWSSAKSDTQAAKPKS